MIVLLISGSTRPGSTNTQALRTLHELDHPGVKTEIYEGLVDLPVFVPGQEPLPDAVRDVLIRIQAADAVVFSTPEYAGGLPGALKNLLDWTVAGGQLYDKPVAWLDVADQGRGGGARAQLRMVLGYVGARIVDRACVHVPCNAVSHGAQPTLAEELQLCMGEAVLGEALTALRP